VEQIALEAAGQLEQAERRAPGQDVIELRMLENTVAGDERHVHVRALAHVAGLVDEDAVVEPRLLRLHLHEDVRQVVRALGDGVERRLDGVRRRHDAQALRVPRVRVREAGVDHDEEPGLGPGRGRQAEAARARGDPVADRAVALAARRRGARDDVAHLLARARQGEARRRGRADEPVEVRLEVVDLPVDDGRGVEDPVAPVHHVIVEGMTMSAGSVTIPPSWLE
jgi:hypothetical protein